MTRRVYACEGGGRSREEESERELHREVKSLKPPSLVVTRNRLRRRRHCSNMAPVRRGGRELATVQLCGLDNDTLYFNCGQNERRTEQE